MKHGLAMLAMRGEISDAILFHFFTSFAFGLCTHSEGDGGGGSHEYVQLAVRGIGLNKIWIIFDSGKPLPTEFEWKFCCFFVVNSIRFCNIRSDRIEWWSMEPTKIGMKKFVFQKKKMKRNSKWITEKCKSNSFRQIFSTEAERFFIFFLFSDSLSSFAFLFA